MKMVELNNGGFAWFDDEDEPKVMQYKWSRHTKGYAVCSSIPTLFMHDLISPPYGDLENDHINRVNYDNRRENLRLVSRSINHLNAKVASNNTSGHKGVSYHKKNRKWVVHIRINGKQKYLGCFNTANEAGEVYKKANLEATS